MTYLSKLPEITDVEAEVIFCLYRELGYDLDQQFVPVDVFRLPHDERRAVLIDLALKGLIRLRPWDGQGAGFFWYGAAYRMQLLQEALTAYDMWAQRQPSPEGQHGI